MLLYAPFAQVLLRASQSTPVLLRVEAAKELTVETQPSKKARKLSSAAVMFMNATKQKGAKISDADAEWLSEVPETLDVFIAQRQYEQAVLTVLKGSPLQLFPSPASSLFSNISREFH